MLASWGAGSGHDNRVSQTVFSRAFSARYKPVKLRVPDDQGCVVVEMRGAAVLRPHPWHNTSAST